MIALDKSTGRMVDNSNGDYLVSELADRDERELYYIIRNKNDVPIFGALVQMDSPVGITKFILKQAWIPSGKQERPSYIDGPHPQIRRLEEFLRCSPMAGVHLDQRPLFEFIDSRSTQEGEL